MIFYLYSNIFFLYINQSIQGNILTIPCKLNNRQDNEQTQFAFFKVVKCTQFIPHWQGFKHAHYISASHSCTFKTLETHGLFPQYKYELSVILILRESSCVIFNNVTVGSNLILEGIKVFSFVVFISISLKFWWQGNENYLKYCKCKKKRKKVNLKSTTRFWPLM